MLNQHIIPIKRHHSREVIAILMGILLGLWVAIGVGL